MKRAWGFAGLCIPTICACQILAAQAPLPPASRLQPRSPNREPVSTQVAASAAVAPQLVKQQADEFLVNTDSGELVVRTTSSPTVRVLARHAAGALYQPRLELVWFQDRDRMSVIDLRIPAAAPIVIARGLSDVERFTVRRGKEAIMTDDGCDEAFVALDWSAKPKIAAQLDEESKPRIVNAAWLRSELARPARAVAARLRFDTVRVPLPAKAVDCEDEDVCGASVVFGASPRELVLVVDKTGGDCAQRACLLRDVKTNRYASPPSAGKWGALLDTARGPCGPYFFNRTQTSFLVGRSWCRLDGVCQDLGGIALGWLVPGDVVGEPGLGNFDAK